MGWASAGGIFDPVAQALIDLEASDEIKRGVLGALITALQEGDWDTEDESYHEFRDDPMIVALFVERGVYDRIDGSPEGILSVDWDEPAVWVLSCEKCGELDQSLALDAVGHDELVRFWASHEREKHDGDGEVQDWMFLSGEDEEAGEGE